MIPVDQHVIDRDILIELIRLAARGGAANPGDRDRVRAIPAGAGSTRSFGGVPPKSEDHRAQFTRSSR